MRFESEDACSVGVTRGLGLASRAEEIAQGPIRDRDVDSLLRPLVLLDRQAEVLLGSRRLPFQEDEPKLAMRPCADRSVVRAEQGDRAFEQVLRALEPPLEPLDPRELVQRPGEVLRVSRLLEDHASLLELLSCFV